MPKDGLFLEQSAQESRRKAAGARWLRRGAIAAAFAGMLLTEPLIGCVRAYSTGDTQTEVNKLVRGRKGEKDAKDALETALKYAPDDTKEAIGRIPENYTEAKALAAALKIQKPDALTYVNLAYGIAAIGTERASGLYRSTGIEFFLRYPKSALLQASENIGMKERSDRPVMLVVFNKNDWNGHFYREGMALGPLTKHYKVILAEAESEDDFYSRVRDTARDYGRIDTLILAGHGAPNSVQLGASDEKGEIDLSDGDELAAVKEALVRHPTVVLASCSTGQDDKSVAKLIADRWDAKVFAPVKAITKTEYNLGDDGELVSVSYDVESRQFAK